jgi:hypothetical protein
VRASNGNRAHFAPEMAELTLITSQSWIWFTHSNSLDEFLSAVSLNFMFFEWSRIGMNNDRSAMSRNRKLLMSFLTLERTKPCHRWPAEVQLRESSRSSGLQDHQPRVHRESAQMRKCHRLGRRYLHSTQE